MEFSGPRLLHREDLPQYWENQRKLESGNITSSSIPDYS